MTRRDGLTLFVLLLESLAQLSAHHGPVKAYRLKERLGLNHRTLRRYLRILEGQGLIQNNGGYKLTPWGYAQLEDVASVRRLAQTAGLLTSEPSA